MRARGGHRTAAERGLACCGLNLAKQSVLAIPRVTLTPLTRGYFAPRTRNILYKLNFYILCAATLKVLLYRFLAKYSAILLLSKC